MRSDQTDKPISAQLQRTSAALIQSSQSEVLEASAVLEKSREFAAHIMQLVRESPQQSLCVESVTYGIACLHVRGGHLSSLYGSAG